MFFQINNRDYSRYLYGSPVKTDNLNSPDLLDFSLLDFDGGMGKPVRGAKVIISFGQIPATTYWFTGYITNDPQPSYLGTSQGQQVHTLQYQATSEDYILNLKPLGIIPPFINTTQGAVLKALISRLSPQGVNIDTGAIQDGQTLARYVCDPNNHFSDVVTEFSNASNYQFRILLSVATFIRQDKVPYTVTVDGGDSNFTPSALQLTASTDPIINDSIILGDIEPQNYMNEFFIGDGATAQFPLISSVFGVDSTLLLDDDFSASTIDSTKWNIYDSNAGYIVPSNGFLNVLGGNNNNTFDVNLQSLNLIPMEGNLRLTHGEFDFVSASTGMIGTLWKGPLNNLSNIVYGIEVFKTGGSGTQINPVVAGVADGSQIVHIDYSKRYIIRTLANFRETKRQMATYTYLDAAGVVRPLQGPSSVDLPTFSTIITEIDPTTANVTNRWYWTNTHPGLIETFATYVAVASVDLHLSVTGITISSTMQVSLKTRPSAALNYTAQIIGPNEIDAMDGMAPVATIVDSNNGASTRSSLLGTPNYNPGQATLTYFKDSTRLVSQLMQPGDISRLCYRSAGAAVGRAQDKVSIALESAAFGDDGLRSETKRDMSPLPRTAAECEIAASARVRGNSYQHWTGTYTMFSGSWQQWEPQSGAILTFKNLPAQFPSNLQAELITQVKTTLLSNDPIDQFQYAVSFGPIDYDARVLASLENLNNVFTPQDTVEMPTSIDVSSLGSTSVPSITTVSYNGHTGDDHSPSDYWSLGIDDQIDFTKYGVQMRYTDAKWGADPSNNLIQNFSSQLFTLPRTTRGRVAFLRLYDKRNMILYSEDLSKIPVSQGDTLTMVRQELPDNSVGMVGRLTAGLGGNQSGLVWGPATPNTPGKTYTFTLSVMTDLGAPFALALYDAVKANNAAQQFFTGTGKWQRVSVTGTFNTTHSTISVQAKLLGLNAHQDLFITRVSLEEGSQETIYCKTAGVPFGQTSRYSTGVHIALPLKPATPGLSINTTVPSAPVATFVMPADMSNVWGVQVRAADNSTVIYQRTLADAGLSLVFNTPPGPTTFYAYTYNLLSSFPADCSDPLAVGIG